MNDEGQQIYKTLQQVELGIIRRNVCYDTGSAPEARQLT